MTHVKLGRKKKVMSEKHKIDSNILLAERDWVGTSKSIYTIIGASNHTDKEREPHDYYATDPIAIEALLEKAVLAHKIWECACGTGELSKKLVSLGYEVKSTDLIDRGYGEGGWTSSRKKRFLREIYLRTHRISMRENLLNMP